MALVLATAFPVVAGTDSRAISFDMDGTLCPLADNEITFAVEGAGFNAGVDNGSPVSLEPFKSDRRKAFYGKALLILQSDGNAGDIRVTATSPGLKDKTLTIKSR